MTKDSTTIEPPTAPVDGFPNIVGYYCYQCLPPSLVKNKTLACTLDKTNDFTGYIAECKYQLNGKNKSTANPKPVRGCYFGITSKFCPTILIYSWLIRPLYARITNTISN